MRTQMARNFTVPIHKHTSTLYSYELEHAGLCLAGHPPPFLSGLNLDLCKIRRPGGLSTEQLKKGPADEKQKHGFQHYPIYEHDTTCLVRVAVQRAVPPEGT